MRLPVPFRDPSPQPKALMSILPHNSERRATWTTRQEDLLDGLEQLFSAEGFRNHTLADLASRLHCSRRTLYELARTKEDLVALVVERFLDRNYDRGIAAMQETSTARARLDSFAAAVIDDAQRISVTFADDMFSSPRTTSLVDNYDQRCITLVESLIRDGQERGEFRDVNAGLAAQAIMAAISRIQNTSVLAVLDLTYGQATRGIIEIFLEGLTAA